MNYHFTFTLSGKDANGKAITSKGTLSMSFKAKTQEAAEKKLRANFFKSVIVTIKSVNITGE